MKKNIISSASIMIAMLLFLSTANGQLAEKPKNRIGIGQIAYNQSRITQQFDLKTLLPTSLLNLEEDESRCEYLREFPNVCVLLA